MIIGQDILWREQCNCPTEEMYKQMVLDKTGGLFRLSVGLMQAFSSIELDFTELLNQLGLYFQIRDDFLNVSSIEYMQTKSFCEDLTEGKFSYPIIHAGMYNNYI
jgi:geranylgeranyl diphosphate synthase type 3